MLTTERNLNRNSCCYFIVAPQEDLNKLSTEELDMAKEAMNVGFLRNAKRPGDEGYEYDKQVDFGKPTEDNDWDSSTEEG